MALPQRCDASCVGDSSRIREEGDDISRSTYVEKAEIVATLRSRALHGRADWVDRELPALIDTYKNAALLRTLDIDVTTLSRRTSADSGVAPERSCR